MSSVVIDDKMLYNPFKTFLGLHSDSFQRWLKCDWRLFLVLCYWLLCCLRSFMSLLISSVISLFVYRQYFDKWRWCSYPYLLIIHVLKTRNIIQLLIVHFSCFFMDLIVSNELRPYLHVYTLCLGVKDNKKKIRTDSRKDKWRLIKTKENVGK